MDAKWNTGYWNTGNSNTGHWNTGNSNTGHWNIGNSNTGNWNTGNWNTGDSNTGFFCESDGPVIFFDYPCGLSRDEAMAAIPHVELPIGAKWTSFIEMNADQKSRFPNAEHIGGCLEAQEQTIQDAMPLVWPTLDVDVRRKFLALPNFDADKFMRITGVDVRRDMDLFPAAVPCVSVSADELVINGVLYRKVPETC